MRISDWSSNVCSSDLSGEGRAARAWFLVYISPERRMGQQDSHCQPLLDSYRQTLMTLLRKRSQLLVEWAGKAAGSVRPLRRSEEHTSELQSLMRLSYDVFCLKKKKKNTRRTNN